MLQIEFLTDLGARVTVSVEHESRLLDVQRHYGRLGWTSGEIPSGGYQFPIENEPDFDWSLIGARKWKSPEGEELVIHRGHAYRRRELEAAGGFAYPKSQTPWQEIQRAVVGQMNTGAILEGAEKYQRIAQTMGLPRDNH